jgi:hypothetical protein
MKTYSPKRSGEIVVVTMDMKTLLTAGATPTVDVSLVSGVDPSPQSLKTGPAVLTAKTKVSQKLTGGVPGCTYQLLFQVDVPATGERFIEPAQITVEN